MSKPRIPAKFAPVLNTVNSYMQRSKLFGGALGGGYNYADTKHDKSWKDYGWPDQIDYEMFFNMYARNGYAKAGVKIPVTYCWLTKPWVQQNNKEDSDEKTPYEKQFEKEANRIKLWRALRQGDLRQRVGRYAALFMVVADNKSPDQPLSGRNNVVSSIRPLYEGQLIPNEVENRRASPRFGMPTYYSLIESGVGNRDPFASQSSVVHHSRVIILSESAAEGEIYGHSALEAGFNSLLNLQKIQGAGGEGFWRQAAQRFVLESTADEASDYSSEELEDLSKMVADMFAGLDAIPSLNGYKVVPLNTQISNPKEFLEANLSEFAASLEGIPRKLISGTQTGVKAADEDTQGFMRLMQSRRDNELADMGQDVIEWYNTWTKIRYPESGASLKWDDLTAPTQMDRLELAVKMVQANRDNVRAGGQRMFNENEIRTEAGYNNIEALGDWDDGLIGADDV